MCFIYFLLAYDQAGLNKSIISDQLVVDTTPPSTGHLSRSTLMASKWFGGDMLNIHIKDFYDDESGIDYYVVTIGSSYHTADILQETTYRQELIGVNIDEAHMTDGHTYYLGVKVSSKWATLVSVTSYNGGQDVVQETTYREELIDVNIDQAHMTDGHKYYLGVKVHYIKLFLSLNGRLRKFIVFKGVDL